MSFLLEIQSVVLCSEAPKITLMLWVRPKEDKFAICRVFRRTSVFQSFLMIPCCWNWHDRMSCLITQCDISKTNIV